MKKIILILFIITSVFLIINIIWQSQNIKKDASSLHVITVKYSCSDNNVISATFYQSKPKLTKLGEPPIPTGNVQIALDDGRKFNLPQTISADGGRYANHDESIIFWSKGDSAIFLENNIEKTYKNCINKTANQNAQLANPAAKNCISKGGKLEMRQGKMGTYGVCLFEDNRQCEEWALLRGQCPNGGIKITGYDNEAEIYCAITGGKVEGVGTPTPMCKRIDGTYCNAQANLDGECPNPNNPNPNSGNVETP